MTCPTEVLYFGTTGVSGDINQVLQHGEKNMENPKIIQQFEQCSRRYKKHNFQQRRCWYRQDSWLSTRRAGGQGSTPGVGTKILFHGIYRTFPQQQSFFPQKPPKTFLSKQRLLFEAKYFPFRVFRRFEWPSRNQRFPLDLPLETKVFPQRFSLETKDFPQKPIFFPQKPKIF